MADTPKIIFLREGGPVASLISDTYTFGMLVGSVWFNYMFIGGSYFLNAVILVMFIMMLISKGAEKKRVFHHLKDLKEFLDRETGK